MNVCGVLVFVICKRPLDAGRVFAPYASSPLALSDRGLFATWLKTMTEAPRMRGPLGFAESFDADREAIAPILTWDGKALPMIAWSGGLVDEIRKYLIADDLYDRFIARARSDYRAFDPDRLEGRHIAIAAPTVRFCAANTGAIGRSATGARARRRPASYHEAS